MKEAHHNGATVRGLQVNPGSNDLIHHTLRHFIQEDFDSLPPKSALSRHEARWKLVEEAGVLEAELDALPSTGEVSIDEEWWREPRQTILIDIHDAGYWPRYLKVVRRYPLPDRGSWQNLPGRTWRLTDPGRATVYARYSTEKKILQVTSAVRKLVEKDRTPANKDAQTRAWLKSFLR